ncbi:PAS domain-containing protein [Streptacidiphilus sp. PB12-B1b]|uniref:sensor histidine kinase n=1 Tax=Streptacidiphilus sp. PB12-B1b TaxID=2705012 RepID=UPI0015F89155|nr:ATP-binding protein [Streptacidiphilus sp. PB12-B1b]QMU76352.1 PAS domain-containing protein [Streptacidiphilus sp. PB12-B1b]
MSGTERSREAILPAGSAPAADEPAPCPPADEPRPSAAAEPGRLDVEDLPDGLVVADADGRVVCFNAAAVRISGIPAASALGRPLAEALPLEDLEGRRWWQLTDPYGGLATRTRQPERNLLLPGGREVLVSARYLRADARTGPVCRVVVALRGTEARQRTERSHAELIATVAHELRSPLTSVKGFTATLLQKWERFTDDQKRLMLETVDADANRVTRLIAELLDISRIDAGRLEIRRQQVDLPAAIRHQVDGKTAAGVAPERFAIRVQEPLPPLWADADKIDQVLGNLLENAVRHGEGTVTIEVQSEKAALAPGQVREWTVVTVSDQGAGIPEESIPRVFTRFWRGSKRGGTGLGLYIVKGIVEAHGGSIAVDRVPEGGARFRFILPAGIPEFMV